MWFANLIFKPVANDGGRRPRSLLEDYSYEQGLPEVVGALGPADLHLVLSWLVAFERASGHFSEKFDVTSHSRDAIRQASTNSIYPVERALIDSVRNLAVESMLADAAAASSRCPLGKQDADRTQDRVVLLE